jgi:hypothetical protein
LHQFEIHRAARGTELHQRTEFSIRFNSHRQWLNQKFLADFADKRFSRWFEKKHEIFFHCMRENRGWETSSRGSRR